MYAFRPVEFKERTKAVVLNSLPFSQNAVATMTFVKRVKPPPPKDVEPIKQLDSEPATPPARLQRLSSKPAAKSASKRQQWSILGLEGSYYTCYANRSVEGVPCTGDWEQLRDMRSDLPRLIVSTCAGMRVPTAKKMATGYFKLYTLIQSMHNDAQFTFRLARVSSSGLGKPSTKVSKRRYPYAVTCANQLLQKPQAFVVACVEWLLKVEKQVRRFQSHVQTVATAKGSNTRLYDALTRLQLMHPNCMRTNKEGTEGFSDDLLLASQLFFQFLGCCAQPKRSDVSSGKHMVRPLPWVVDDASVKYLPLSKGACTSYCLPDHMINNLPSSSTQWYRLETVPVTTYAVTLAPKFASHDGSTAAIGKRLQVPKPVAQMRLTRAILRTGMICVFIGGRFVGYYVLDAQKPETDHTIPLVRLGK